MSGIRKLLVGESGTLLLYKLAKKLPDDCHVFIRLCEATAQPSAGYPGNLPVVQAGFIHPAFTP
jgi:hypothetical protein